MLRRRMFSPWSDNEKLAKNYSKLEMMLRVSAERIALCVQSLNQIKNIDTLVSNINLQLRILYQNKAQLEAPEGLQK